MSKIPTQNEIEKIVTKSFYDLGYKKKYSKEYYIDLVNETFKELDLEEKCSPSYISNLPGNLKTSTSDELQHRLDVIDERINEYQELADSEAWIQEDRQKTIDELTQENEEWQEKIDDVELKEKQLNTYMDDLQSDAYEFIEDITDRFTKHLPDLNRAVIDGRPNTIYSELMGLNELFSDGGIILSNNANGIRYLAQNIEDYAIQNEETVSYNDAHRISDDLMKLADKHDATKNKTFGNLVDELGTWRDDKTEWQKNIDKNNTEIERSREVQKDSRKQQADFENRVSKLKDEQKRTSDAKKRKDTP